MFMNANAAYHHASSVSSNAIPCRPTPFHDKKKIQSRAPALGLLAMTAMMTAGMREPEPERVSANSSRRRLSRTKSLLTKGRLKQQGLDVRISALRPGRTVSGRAGEPQHRQR